jgi:hypothetical protein
LALRNILRKLNFILEKNLGNFLICNVNQKIGFTPDYPIFLKAAEKCAQSVKTKTAFDGF